MRISFFRRPKTGPIASAKRNTNGHQARFAALIAMMFSGLVASLVILAWHTNVPQITRAPGTIVPMGDYAQIEVMEGGIVERVYVQDGDHVQAGDMLVQLRHPDLSKEQQRLREKIAMIERKLLHAQTILGALEHGGTIRNSDLITLRNQKQHRTAATLKIYAESQRIKRQSILQQKEMLKTLAASQRFTQERVERKKKELERSYQLHGQKLTTSRDLAREADQLDALHTAASDGDVRLAQARSALTLAQADISEQTLSLRHEMLEELEELNDTRSELLVSLRIVNLKLDDLRITSPNKGIIQSVAFPNSGEIIAPGETIFELLPLRQELMVEARIPNGDIGHVSLGQPLNLTVDTYDARRFGKVKGNISALSPVPLIDDQTGETYFRASIQVKDSFVGSGTFKRPLQAGMTVVAEMKTGENSLLAYMLKPVHRTIDTAFGER